MSYQYRELTDIEGRLCLIDAGRDHFNLGGVAELVIVPQVFVIGTPTSASIQLLPGARLFSIRFSPETGGFSEKMPEDDAGVYYNQVLTVQIPKDRPEITTFKNIVKRSRYLLMYRDMNGLVKVLPQMRLKLDLDTGTAPNNYNGHTLTATRQVTDPAPAYELPEGADGLTDAVELTQLAMYYQAFTLPGGISPGQLLQLRHPVLFNNSALVVFNQSLRLRPGMHYSINDTALTLDFRDEVDGSGPSTIQVWAPAGLVGGSMNLPMSHLEQVEVSYTSGVTFDLPSAPLDADHLLITFNQSAVLLAGTDYTLSGNTVTLLFAGDPFAGSPDTFHCIYWRAVPEGSGVTVAGFAHFSFSTSRIVDQDFFELPNVPLPATLYLRMDSGLLLLEGQSFNINGRFIEWLEDVPPPTGTGLIDIDVWYAY